MGGVPRDFFNPNVQQQLLLGMLPRAPQPAPNPAYDDFVRQVHDIIIEGERSGPHYLESSSIIPRSRAVATSRDTPMGSTVIDATGIAALGRGVSTLERAAGGVVDLATQATGIPMAADAGRNLAEAVHTGDPLRGAAAAGQGALAAMPFSRAIGPLMATLPRAAGTTAAFAGVPLAASTSFLPDDAQAQSGPPPPQTAGGEDARIHQLLVQRAALQRQADEARVRREGERKTGTGPRFQAADQEFQRLSDQLSGLDSMIMGEQRAGSPAAKLEAEQNRIRAQEENQRRQAATPFRERYPELAGAMPYMGLGLSAGLPFALKGLANAGTWMPGSASRRLDAATERAFTTRDPRELAVTTREVRNALDELPTWRSDVAKGGAAAAAGGALTAEANLFPDQYDAFNLPPGPAQQMARDRALSPLPYLERGVVGTLTGLSGYKAADLIPSRQANVPRARAIAAESAPFGVPVIAPPAFDANVNRWRQGGRFVPPPQQ